MAYSVWLAQDVQTRWLWPAVAKYLVLRHNLFPVFIVQTPQDAEYYWAGLGPNPIGAVVVADYERRHGISLMRAILQGDRHLGRGFMSGAERFATSKISDNASLGHALGACPKSIDFWERLAARFPPRLVLNYGGGHGIVQKPLALLCRRKDIPFRVLSSGRFADFACAGIARTGRDEPRAAA